MDVGNTLRSARERRGLTIAQLSLTTKIPVHILQAIEENAFERVPRGIFARGFLRSYAKEVGLDPGDIVDMFLQQTEEVLAEQAPGDADRDREEFEPAPIDADLRPATPGWSYLAIIAALLVAFIAASRYGDDAATGGDAAAILAGADTAVTESTAGEVANTGGVQPVATSGDANAAGDVPLESSTLRFVMEATEECWVEAIVDGRRVVYRLMQPGERATIESGQEIVLRVGDPGALTYSVNGRPGEPLGRAGVPVTVRFTNQGA